MPRESAVELEVVEGWGCEAPAAVGPETGL